MPTDRPTRWPTPISASEKLAETCGRAAAPTRKLLAAASDDQTRSAASSEISGRDDRARPTISEAAAVLLGAADAGADLEHLGRGDALGIGQVGPVTSARRSGTENITPRMPPMPVTATDGQ